ncbi:MAG TPA: hypothetical protein VF981_17755 [Gemmatimonadaceae bacterium]
MEHRATRIVADDSGRFEIPIASGAGFIRVRRIGYQPIEIAFSAGGDTTIVAILPALAAYLSRTVVLARAAVRSLELRGFYRRLQDRQKGINAGQFITAEEIEQRRPNRITQILEGRTGIRVVRAKGAGTNCLSGNDPRCWVPTGTNGCYMTAFFDGMRLNDMSAPNSPARIDEIVTPSAVAGIEIYTTPGKTPPEYQLLAGRCGVVLLWSK